MAGSTGECDTVVAELRFGLEAFHHWDVPTNTWRVEPGAYDLVIASSAAPRDEDARISIVLA